MIGGPIEILVIDLEGEIHMVHGIIACLVPEDILVGALVPEEGNHIEIVQILQNVGMLGVLITCQDHLNITGEVGLPLRTVMIECQSSDADLGLNLSKIGVSQARELRKPKRKLHIMVEGGQGLCLLKLRTLLVAD